jgi:hypothetical protein
MHSFLAQLSDFYPTPCGVFLETQFSVKILDNRNWSQSLDDLGWVSLTLWPAMESVPRSSDISGVLPADDGMVTPSVTVVSTSI